MEPTLIADYECHTGEGPIWHPGLEQVYWVDIPHGRLFSYDPTGDHHKQCLEVDPLRAVTIEADDSLLLYREDGTVLHWDGEKSDELYTGIADDRDVRFNDVIADPVGRVFCGVMETEGKPGALYRLDPDGTFSRAVDGLTLPNGLGFTPDSSGLYLTDSHADRILQFDYDIDTGALSRQRVFVDTTADPGKPDGLTVDSHGNVWSGRWNGGRLVRYTPDGEFDQDVTFPARKVTSLTLGGSDNRDAYVTTARGAARNSPGSRDDEGNGAGGLFRMRVDVPGVSEFRSQISI